MKSTPALLLTLAAVGLSAFAGADLSKLPPAAKQSGVTYAKDIKPIFEASCFRCHGERQQKGDLRLDSLEAALKGGENGKDIMPGKSAESPLVIAVAQLDPKTAMPKRGGGPGGKGGPGGPGGGKVSSDGKGSGAPGGSGKAPDGKGFGGKGGPGGGPQSKPLTTEQVALVRAWIDQGAK